MEAASSSLPPSDDAAPPSIHWYARSAVEQFLSEVDAECTRLRATIVVANERAARARSTIGFNQTMVDMLLDAQREVREIRSQAESVAAEIRATTDQEMGLPAVMPMAVRGPASVEIHPPLGHPQTLAAWETADGAPSLDVDPGPGAPTTNGQREPATRHPSEDPAGEDDYFRSLKNAIDDEDPFGPSPL